MTPGDKSLVAEIRSFWCLGSQSEVAKGALKGIRDLAEDWDDESRETFHVSITKLRLREMGVECEELTMLRHDSIGPERPFPQNTQFEPLSPNYAKFKFKIATYSYDIGHGARVNTRSVETSCRHKYTLSRNNKLDSGFLF